MICKLKRSVWVEQALRQWYKKFAFFMVGNAYTWTRGR